MSYRLIIVFAVVFFNALHTKAQSNLWFAPNRFMTTPLDQKIQASAYSVLQVDYVALQNECNRAPSFEQHARYGSNSIITLPMPDGTFGNYAIFNYPQMAPQLQQRFASIQTYTGVGINDPHSFVKLDYTPLGFHAMILSPNHSPVFIDPLSLHNTSLYMVYYKKDFVTNKTRACEVLTKNNTPIATAHATSGDCSLRHYRVAIACTGEYSDFFGGTVINSMAAINTSLNRCNGVYERELNMHLNLVNNNDLLIQLNAATDPYTNNEGGDMLEQNQLTVDAIIGNDNYDIGHVFSTGGGGVAYLASICNNDIKAGGVTGSSSPVGDPFDIDYVVHEMGHQFNGNHTQNNDCNRNDATAMEPGSAVTIMGYAGICSPNVAPHSIETYHAVNIEEIFSYITNPTYDCSTRPSYTNTAPYFTSADGIYFIPCSTPFFLTATATDPDGDSLTFSWEQNDNGVGVMPPDGLCDNCPNFTSLLPKTSPTRYFPDIIDLIADNVSIWEKLSSVTRAYNFVVTARDNTALGGCVARQNTLVEAVQTGAAFEVTYPSAAGLIVEGYSLMEVTWNVAGTASTPINCDEVTILLTTDGGATFSMLESGVPNTGSQVILLPNISTTQAILMVVCNENIFYNVSSEFTITMSSDSLVATDFVGFDVSATCGSVNGIASFNALALGAVLYVQKSLDMLSWVTVDTLSSDTSMSYNFELPTQASNTAFYRLLLVSVSGDSLVMSLREVEKFCPTIVTPVLYVSNYLGGIVVHNGELLNGAQVLVYSSAGALVYAGALVENQQKIGLGVYASGLYYVRVLQNDSMLLTQKVAVF